jgi:uncharacterized membrane protein YebE (DUF533 family)
MLKTLAVTVLLLALSTPTFAQSAQPTPQQTQDKQAKATRGYFKVAFGGLAASIGVGLMVAGNNPDAFTGEKSTGQLALGLGLLGTGGYLVWQGMKDTSEAKAMPSVGVVVQRRKAGLVYRRSW